MRRRIHARFRESFSHKEINGVEKWLWKVCASWMDELADSLHKKSLDEIGKAKLVIHYFSQVDFYWEDLFDPESRGIEDSN